MSRFHNWALLAELPPSHLSNRPVPISPSLSQAPLFVDSLLLLLRAGSGGDGCSSFARAKYIPYGPASGGHGGKGGDIYIKAVNGLSSLSKLGSGGIGSTSASSSISTSGMGTSGTIKSETGSGGTGSFRDGKKGKDRIIEVPVGTIVRVYKAQIWDWNQEEWEEKIMRKEYEDDLIAKLKNSRKEEVVEDENDENDEEEEESYGDEKVKAEELDEELDEEAAKLRNQRDLVWRHYPRGGPSAEEQEAEDSYRRNEFRIAEERLGLALRRERREEQNKIKELYKERKRSANEMGSSGNEWNRELEHKDQNDGFWLSEEEEGKSTLDQQMEEIETQEVETPEEPLFTIDFNTPTPSTSSGHLLLSGGSGGYGNPYFLTSLNRSPKFATKGQRGGLLRIHLELKVPADVGFVGLPNVGKSSLLQSMSGADEKGAKTGNFNFTTLNPNVGVVRFDEKERLKGTGKGRIGGRVEREKEMEFERNRIKGENENESSTSTIEEGTETSRLTLLDLPGLLPGASKDVGLGHSFLRHAERCPLLIYVVDVSSSNPEPWKDVQVLKDELEEYKSGLSKRAMIVVANKADALGPSLGLEEKWLRENGKTKEDLGGGAEEEAKRLSQKEAKEKMEILKRKVEEIHGKELLVVPVSAMWRLGVENLARKLKDLVKVQQV